MLERVRGFLHQMLDWVEGWAHHPQAEWALFTIAFAESSFFPIPPDVLLIALCLGDPGRSLTFALICAVGSVLGGMLGYGIGFYGGRPIVQRFFAENKVRTVERLYGRYNAWATGIAGLTPLPYKIFTITGGAFAVSFKIFVVASILSRSLRFFAVAGLIYYFGEPVRAFIDRHLGWLTIVFVIVLAASYWLVGRGFGRAGEAEVDG